MKFEDIKIVELDVEMTRPSEQASGMRHMFLKLSAYPSSEWANFFESERRFPRHNMWRHAWIEGNYIVVDCVPEEIKQYHLADLKTDVANSNKKYKDFLQQVEERTLAENRRQAQEDERLKNLKDGLNFE